MHKMPHLCVAGFLLSFVSPIQGATFPKGCEPQGFVFNKNELMLNKAGEQAFYLFQNTSNEVLLIKHKEKQPVFMSPGWETKIAPSRWAAFASNEKNMPFQCFKLNNQTIVAADCKSTMRICQYTRVKFALSNQGNYWVMKNGTLSIARHQARKRGIYLRW